MKIVVYLDGKHNSVEVKNKILSVLPDAKYMIFDAGSTEYQTHIKTDVLKNIIEQLEYKIKISDKDVCQYYDSKDVTYNNTLKEVLHMIKEMVGED